MSTREHLKCIKSEQHCATTLSGAPAPGPHEERMAELFTKYHAKLVKSLVARTGSWDEARDIASQAFVEVLAQRPGTVNFLGPYLYRTARNIATNRAAHEVVRKEKQSIVGYEPQTQPSPESLWECQEHVAVLRQAIAALSPRVSMAFVLRVWDELSYEEIVSRFAASGVDLTARTVQRYVAAAFAQCQRSIQAAQNAQRPEAK